MNSITVALKSQQKFKEVDANHSEAVPIASELADKHVTALQSLTATRWTDVFDCIQKKANSNRKYRNKNVGEALPKINVGDLVLVADPHPRTKLHYKWTGPWVVSKPVSQFVYEVQSLATRPRASKKVHICLIRRFSSRMHNVSERLQKSIDRDYPENIVDKLLSHTVDAVTGELWIEVSWFSC